MAISTYTEAIRDSRPIEYHPVPLHGETPLPGVTGIFAPFTALPDAYRGWKAAKMIGDKEGVTDNIIRAVQSFFSFSHAGTQIAFYALQAGVYLKLFSHPILPFLLYTSGPLACAITGLGLAACVFAAAVESIGFINTANFDKHISPADYEELKESLKNDYEELKKVFENTASTSEECDDAARKFMQNAGKIKLPKGASEPLVKAWEDLKNSPLFPLLYSPQKKTITYTKKMKDEILSTALKVQTNVLVHQLEKIKTIFFEISEREENEIELYVAHRLKDLPLEQQVEREKAIREALLQKKYSTLTRRVHPRLAAEIKDNVSGLVGSLKANIYRAPDLAEPAVQKAEKLMAAIKTQSTKKKVMHVIGIVAALFGMATLIASIIGCPFLLIIILAALTLAFGMARGAMHFGSMDREGWDFSISDCAKGLIPEFIRNLPETIRNLPETIKNLPSSIEQSFEDFKKLLTQDSIAEDIGEGSDIEEECLNSDTDEDLSDSDPTYLKFYATGLKY